MRRITNIILLTFGLFTIQSIRAQSDFILLNQAFNPHKTSINPAFLPKEEFYLGLPVISNSYLSYSNSGFTYRDLIKKKGITDSIYFDFNGFLSNLPQKTLISAQLQSDLFSTGWREGRWYINANITEKVNFQTQFQRDLMEVAIEGNGPKIGETADLGNLFISAMHYREYALGISRDIMCKLRVGATFKYLYGMENLDITRSNISLTTDETTFDLTGTSDILINTSGFKNFNADSLTSAPYLFNRQNRGFALNLGAEYKINDKFDVFASALDLGKINWLSQPVNYYNKVEQFSFSGISLNEFISSSSDTVVDGIQNYLDSLGNTFSIKEKNESYSTTLPKRFYVGGHYYLETKNSIQFVMMGNTYKGKLYPSVSVGFSKRLADVFEISVNSSYANRSIANLGAGFTLNLGLTQFSFISDNLLGVFNKYNTRGTNIRAGITLVTGYDFKRPNPCDNDDDGVLNKTDECPNIPGPVSLNGCPDSDKDGIADKFDECPLEMGEVAMKGCPDSDQDGIANKLDKCPNDKGKPEFEGCPDTDKDGLIDLDDQCPNIAGLIYLKGCPDRDRDSIADKDDECPDFAGPAFYSGCPDTDGDSLIDKVDFCPDQAGLKVFKGCPDTDNDGFPDYLDACPDVAGPEKGCPKAPEVVGPIDSDGDGVTDEFDKCPQTPGVISNNGCPELAKEDQEVLNTAFANLEFESGKDVIKTSSNESLKELATLLSKKSKWKILISGHTDNVGKPQANTTLSQKRASALKTFLINQGVESNRIDTEWFGQTKPIASNKTADGRQKNRRVEMTIITGD